MSSFGRHGQYGSTELGTAAKNGNRLGRPPQSPGDCQGARRPPGKIHTAKVPEPSLQSGGCKKRGRRNTVCLARTSDAATALCSRGKRGWGSAVFTQRAVPRASEVAARFSAAFCAVKKRHRLGARTVRVARRSPPAALSPNKKEEGRPAGQPPSLLQKSSLPRFLSRKRELSHKNSFRYTPALRLISREKSLSYFRLQKACR